MLGISSAARAVMAASLRRISRNLEGPLVKHTRDAQLVATCACKGASVPHRPSGLDTRRMARHIQGMAHSFLIFDFGGNEEAAQQARHRIEGWKQGFRLDKKLQLKFERKDREAKADAAPAAPPKAAKSAAKGKRKSDAKSKTAAGSGEGSNSEPDASAQIRLIVRLDFSDHEKLSHQRWIERIPSEEPFKNANPRIIRTGEPAFKATSDLFDSLD
jgi:hypothetical protein